jgi:hypothetical protein
VLNTADIRDFCVVGMKTAGSGVLSLKAVTGDCATSARQHGHHMAQKVMALNVEVEGFINSKMSAHQVSGFYDMIFGIYGKEAVMVYGFYQYLSKFWNSVSKEAV